MYMFHNSVTKILVRFVKFRMTCWWNFQKLKPAPHPFPPPTGEGERVIRHSEQDIWKECQGFLHSAKNPLQDLFGILRAFFNIFTPIFTQVDKFLGNR